MSHLKTHIENQILDSSVPSENRQITSGKQRIFNDSSIFFKGLIGLILCLVPASIIGLVLVKMSLDQAKVAIHEYNQNPSLYRLSSIRMITQGKKFAYIGLILFILELIALIAYMTAN